MLPSSCNTISIIFWLYYKDVIVLQLLLHIYYYTYRTVHIYYYMILYYIFFVQEKILYGIGISNNHFVK